MLGGKYAIYYPADRFSYTQNRVNYMEYQIMSTVQKNLPSCRGRCPAFGGNVPFSSNDRTVEKMSVRVNKSLKVVIDI